MNTRNFLHSVTAKTVGLGAFLGSVASLAGCASAKDDPPALETLAATSQGASKAKLSTFEFVRSEQSTSTVGERAGRLASAMGSSTDVQLNATANFMNAKVDVGSIHAQLSPSVNATHLSGNNALYLVDEAVTSDAFSTSDVGEATARKVFLAGFASLLASGAVERAGLNAGTARLSALMQGEGVSGQAPRERLKEYSYSVPRTINGVEVFDAGVEISVHRNGKVARVKAFGPTVLSTLQPDGTEVPTAAGASFVQAVPQATADARIKAEYPKATVKAIGLRYWMPEGVARAVIAPRHMYLVVPTANINGQKIKGRAFYVAYSTEDAAAAAAVWPNPTPDAKGDPRP